MTLNDFRMTFIIFHITKILRNSYPLAKHVSLDFSPNFPESEVHRKLNPSSLVRTEMDVVFSRLHRNQGTIGCTPGSVPMVFIVFSRDSWGL